MAICEPLTKLQESQIREYIKYDPDTGKLFWLNNAPPRGIAGNEITVKNNRGYIFVSIKGRRYMGHRLAWFITYGEWPQLEIDHINGNVSDNRIINLRKVTKSENAQNRIEHRNGNPIGVSWVNTHKKWVAMAPRNFLNRNSTKQATIGRYDSKEEAALAVIEFCAKHIKTSN
jgi:hypothetical protein